MCNTTSSPCPGQRNQDRRALQQLALNVHVKHSYLCWGGGGGWEGREGNEGRKKLLYASICVISLAVGGGGREGKEGMNYYTQLYVGREGREGNE